MNHKQMHFNKDPDSSGKIGWPERIGYGAGFFGIRFVFAVVGSYAIIYLTNVVLLDIAAISVIIAVSKFFDGISDLIIGNIIDHTSSRLGKARVWLLRMCLPFALSLLLFFYVPPHFPVLVKYIYVFLMYNMVNTVFYTFMSLSHYSLISLMTRDREEQGLLGNIEAAGRSIGNLASGILFVKLLTFFSDSPGKQNTQRGYTLATLVCCIVMLILVLVSVFLTKERVQDPPVPAHNKSGGFKEYLSTFKVMTSNKYWIIFLLCQIITMFGAQLVQAGIPYYALYILQDMEQISWILSSMMGPAFVIQFFTPFLMLRFGKRKVYLAGILFGGVGAAGFGLASPNIPLMIVFNILRGIGIGMVQAMTMGIVADIITYTHHKTGRFAVGVGNAGMSASEKLGNGLSSVLFGFSMSLAGFNAALDIQPFAVSIAVISSVSWLPAILHLLAFLLFLLLFDLD